MSDCPYQCRLASRLLGPFALHGLFVLAVGYHCFDGVVGGWPQPIRHSLPPRQ